MSMEALNAVFKRIKPNFSLKADKAPLGQIVNDFQSECSRVWNRMSFEHAVSYTSGQTGRL